MTKYRHRRRHRYRRLMDLPSAHASRGNWEFPRWIIPTNAFLERVATKAGFQTSNVPLRGFIRYQSSMRFPKGEKKRPRRQDKTVWDDLRLQSLEAFPAASGKFHKTKPDSIRKTGGNAVSGLDQELARRARRLKKHISPESVWPRLSVVMAKQTGGPAPSP